MIRDITLPSVYMGCLAALVGYTASFAIVLSGLTAMGATQNQAATGLFFASLGMAVCSIWLPAMTRTPVAIAWSTPGAAFLASTSVMPGGFAEAVGALIVCAGLLALIGIVPAMSRIVASIPKPVASGLLAGVLLQLCLAPATALGIAPELTLPIIAAWIAGLSWNRLAAMPAAIGAFLFVLAFAAEPTSTNAPDQTDWFPAITAVIPVFTLDAVVSLSLPLFLVTMAGQNIPGFAVLELNGYAVERPRLLRSTGLASLLIAPFGSVPVNMSAITAAMMAGEDAGADPKLRYWAAITSGIVYIFLACASVFVVSLASLAPVELITAIAGLALIPALVGSLSAAFSTADQTEAPALTFLISASGMSLFGVSGAFWGVLAGMIVWLAKSRRR